MKFGRLALMILFAVIAVAQGNFSTETYRPNVEIGHVPLQDRAPAFSSPQVEMAPNGDRVSHYAPYYHRERD